MSAQVSIVFDAGYVAGVAWRGADGQGGQLELIRAAVNHLSHKEVVFATGTDKSTLSDALNETRDRRWRAEWTHVVKAMLAARVSDAIAQDLLRKIVEADVAASGFTLVDPDNLTPEQIVAAMSDEERERIRKRVRGGRR